jgi:uncharacterized membrane protein
MTLASEADAPGNQSHEPDLQRLFAAGAGGALALGGIARGGVTGVATSALGGGLIYKAFAPGRRATPGATAATHQGQTVKAERAVTIDRPREDLYDFWRDLSNLPRIMQGIESVHVKDDKHSHWSMQLPGQRIEWDAEIFCDEPGSLMAWRSLEHANIANAGTVIFEDGPPGRGTIVKLVVNYEPPAGALGKLVAGLMPQEPGKLAGRTLRRFKQLSETGEIATSEYRRGLTSNQVKVLQEQDETARAGTMAGAGR